MATMNAGWSPTLHADRVRRCVKPFPYLTKRECKEEFPRILERVLKIGDGLGFVIAHAVYTERKNGIEVSPHAHSPDHTFHPYQFAARKDHKGIFKLIPTDSRKSSTWVEDAMSEAESDARGTEVKDMLDVIESGKTFGSQALNITAAKKKLRTTLNIIPFPLIIGESENLQMLAEEQKELENTPLKPGMVDISTKFSPVKVQMTVGNLLTAIYHHGGAHRTWLIIAPRYKEKFEKHLAGLYGRDIGRYPCSQFMNHLSLWLDPDEVLNWGITFTIFQQWAGEVIFMVPGAYYWGFSEGFNVVESRLMTPTGWEFPLTNYKPCMNTICEHGWGGGENRIVEGKIVPQAGSVVSDTESSESSDDDDEGMSKKMDVTDHGLGISYETANDQPASVPDIPKVLSSTEATNNLASCAGESAELLMSKLIPTHDSATTPDVDSEAGNTTPKAKCGGFMEHGISEVSDTSIADADIDSLGDQGSPSKKRKLSVEKHVAAEGESKQKLEEAEKALVEMKEALASMTLDRDNVAKDRDNIAKERDELRAALKDVDRAMNSVKGLL